MPDDQLQLHSMNEIDTKPEGNAARHAPDVSAVVVSHDRYADVWPGFFSLLFRFWPDLPYRLYLVSNDLPFLDEQITSLCVGDDLSWSETLARGLDRISSRFVLLILEDFFLCAPVDTDHVLRLQAAMVAQGAAYLRLVPQPSPDLPLPGQIDIGMIAKGAPYRTSLQMAFWDRRVLLDLLRENKSAWDFELKGSRRSDQVSYSFLSVCENVAPIQYRHAVRRGKWLPATVRHFSQAGIPFDFSARPIESELYLRWAGSGVRRQLGRAWRFVTRRTL